MVSCHICFGTGVLGDFSTPRRFTCPWCDGKKEVVPEVNAVSERIEELLPAMGKYCIVFGNGTKVEREPVQQVVSVKKEPVKQVPPKKVDKVDALVSKLLDKKT